MHVKGASCMSGEVVQQNLESQFHRESNVLQEDVDVDKNFSVELTELSLSLRFNGHFPGEPALAGVY